jgi:RNA polymerase sigma factor (TIGR02999 family)
MYRRCCDHLVDNCKMIDPVLLSARPSSCKRDEAPLVAGHRLACEVVMTDVSVTQLLQQLSAGERDAADVLLPRVYTELKAIAHRQLRGERLGHTLNATALVHEAYLRLGLTSIPWQDRAHFFAVAARAMRRVLIDYADARRAQKRGGDAQQIELDDGVAAAPERQLDDLLALDEALTRLEAIDPRQAQIVECHVFAGMSLGDTAAALDISAATVSRDWAMARAWLNRTMDQTGRSRW